MSSSPLSITLWGPTAFSISLILIATPFILYYTQTAVMYTVTPSGCDAALYANQSSWYTGPWVIIPAYGVCPVETYSYTQIAGYMYSECMEFTDKIQWAELDSQNKAEGYQTYMSTGANVWARADELLIIGTVCLFLIPFAIIGLGSEEDDEHVLMIFTLLAAVPIALFVTLHMFLTVQRTDQIEPEAWALVMFSSCDVTIRTTYGLYLVMYVLAVCGVLVMTSYGLLVYYGVKEYRKNCNGEVETTAAADMDDSHQGGPIPNQLLVSRSWYYGRTNARERDTVLAVSRGGELEPLIDSGVVDKPKSKVESRIYQTAVEYRVDRNDFYSLPTAPAASITHEGIL